jgi:hypothetical protein
MKHVVTQQRPQRLLVPSSKRRHDHLKRDAGAPEKLGRVKARVGSPDLPYTVGDRVGGRSAYGWVHRGRAGFGQRRELVRDRPRTAHEQIATPLVSGASAKHAAQAQDEKSSNHCEQDDVEVLLKITHLFAHPAVVGKQPAHRPTVPFLTTWGPDVTTTSRFEVIGNVYGLHIAAGRYMKEFE